MGADKSKGSVNSGEMATPASYDTSEMFSASLPQKHEVKQAQTGSQWALGRNQVRYGKAELPGAFEQVERLSTVLRHAKPVDADKVHRQVDAALARLLQIEDDGILTRLIGQQIRVVAGVLLAHAPHAAGIHGVMRQGALFEQIFEFFTVKGV